MSATPLPRYSFCRPQNQKQVTRFLFTGCSDPDFLTTGIHSAFSDFDVECIVKPPGARFCFVVFASEVEAQRAKEFISSARISVITATKFADAKVLPQVIDLGSRAAMRCHLHACIPVVQYSATIDTRMEVGLNYPCQRTGHPISSCGVCR